ncbi:MAG: hypothetical protein OHK0029_41360 [Armatimonadaceae bacterium]
MQRVAPVGERREPAMVLILTLVTCGIYYLFFVYNTSRETKEFLNEQGLEPGMEVLLSIVTCGIYTVYWDYMIAQRIVKMQRMVGLREVDNGVLYLVLNFLGLGIVPSMIQQQHLNEIWDAARSSGYAMGDFPGAF